MRFGVREICEVTFRPLAALDIGSQHFEKNQPCLFIDTATASNMEVATTTVYAQGGRGNARLIAWEGEKTATFTITDALLSPISFSMLSGAGVVDSEAGNKIVHTTFEGTLKSSGDNQDADYIVVPASTISGYTPITHVMSKALQDKNIKYDDYKLYAMVLDDQQTSVLDYIGSTEISETQIADTTLSGVYDKDDLVISLNPKNQNGEKTVSVYKDHVCRVDCYSYTTNAAVTTLSVDAENFGGTYYIEAETLFRDEATGHDFPATFIIPKGKIQGNFTFNMASTGDPSTFDFTIDCTVGTVRGSSSKSKVLYAIDIIDNISTSDSHTENATKDTSTSTATYPKAEKTN